MLNRNVGPNNPMYGKKHSEETKRKIAEARKKYTKERHPSWKGGKRVNHNGYIEILKPEHPRARGRGYVFEHILVAEEKIGRPLNADETVHHVDGNRKNNIPENLEVITRSEHTKKYHTRPHKGIYKKCPMCGTKFYDKPSHISKRLTCSRSCAGKLGNLVWEANKRCSIA